MHKDGGMNQLIHNHDNKYQNGSSLRKYFTFSDSWELQSEEKTLYGQVDDAMIGGLRPAVIYQVRVFAENVYGRSVASDESSLITTKGVLKKKTARTQYKSKL